MGTLGRYGYGNQGRADANQKTIVGTLVAAGATVIDLHKLGQGGVPDLLVGYRYRNMLIEVKMPGANPSPVQRAWHSAWRGLPVVVVRNEIEALIVIGALGDDSNPDSNEVARNQVGPNNQQSPD